MVATTRTEADRRNHDLAAELTDFALEGMAQAGVHGETVALELALWRTLADALERESRWQRWTRMSNGAPPDSVLVEVIHRAALTVAVAFAPHRDPAELERRLQPWVAGLSFTPRQRGLLAERTARTEQDWGRATDLRGGLLAIAGQ